MRRLLVAVIVALTAQAAQAADPPILRGSFREPPPVVSRTVWEGFYVGGQGSYTFADMNFRTTNDPLVTQFLTNSPIDETYPLPPWYVMGGRSDQRFGYGAFIGYNGQWENVIIGVDATYTRGALNGADGGMRINAFRLGEYDYTVTTVTNAALTLHDYGSIRIRGGYTMGDFMGYAFAGIALGRADINRSVAVGVNVAVAPGAAPTTPPPLPPVNPAVGLASNHSNDVLYGYAFGLGAEYMLFGGLFGRIEWEHMRFNSIVNVGLHTVRGGIGYRF